LNVALATAASNGQDDVIKIRQGTYNGNFIYTTSTEAFGLTLEGGYTAECGSRVVDAINTVLNAQNDGTVIVLSTPNIAANFVMDGITLQNGNVSGNHGGGLYCNTNGRVTITNNNCNYSAKKSKKK